MTRLATLETTMLGQVQQGLMWARVQRLEDTVSERIAFIEQYTFQEQRTGTLAERLANLEGIMFGGEQSGLVWARILALEGTLPSTASFAGDPSATPSADPESRKDKPLIERVALLEEEVYSQEQTGTLDVRLEDLEQSMLGQTQSGLHQSRIATLETTFSARIVFLEKSVLGQEQVGGLENRLWALEESVLGKKQEGALWTRMSALETTLTSAKTSDTDLGTAFLNDLKERTADLERQTYNLVKTGPLVTRLEALETSNLGQTSSGTLWDRVEALEEGLGIAGSRQLHRRLTESTVNVAHNLLVALHVQNMAAKTQAIQKLTNQANWQVFQTHLADQLGRFGERDLVLKVLDGDFVSGIVQSYASTPEFGSSGPEGNVFGSAGPESSEEEESFIVGTLKEVPEYVFAIIGALAVLVVVLGVLLLVKYTSFSRNKVAPNDKVKAAGADGQPTPDHSKPRKSSSSMETAICLVLVVALIVVVLAVTEVL